MGISAMLVTAVLAGAAGGAVALSSTQGTPAPAAPSVTLHQVAEEATSSPTPTPSVAAAAEPDAAPVDEPAADPAPVVQAPEVAVGAVQDAEEAADRAAAEADRAEDAADRAEKAAQPKPTTAPKPTVEPSPAPAPDPFCAPNHVIGRGEIGEVRVQRVEPVTDPGMLPKDGYEMTWKCFASDSAEGGTWRALKKTVIPAPAPVTAEPEDPTEG